MIACWRVTGWEENAVAFEAWVAWERAPDLVVALLPRRLDPRLSKTDDGRRPFPQEEAVARSWRFGKG